MKRLTAIALLMFCSVGCQNLLHDLQPDRPERVTYVAPLGRTDGVYFSVDDPLDLPIQKSKLTVPTVRATETDDAAN